MSSDEFDKKGDFWQSSYGFEYYAISNKASFTCLFLPSKIEVSSQSDNGRNKDIITKPLTKK